MRLRNPVLLFAMAAAALAAFALPAAAQQVKVLDDYTMTREDLDELEARLGVKLKSGYNTMLSAGEYRFQLNYLKCAPEDVEALNSAVRLIAPRSTVIRTQTGAYELIAGDPELARNVILSLDGVGPLEKGKLIPLQLPEEWVITGEAYFDFAQIEMLKKSYGKGITDVMSQVIRAGGTGRIQISYMLCDNATSAEFVFGKIYANKADTRSVKRLGKLVIDISSDNPELIPQAMAYFKN